MHTHTQSIGHNWSLFLTVSDDQKNFKATAHARATSGQQLVSNIALYCFDPTIPSARNSLCCLLKSRVLIRWHILPEVFPIFSQVWFWNDGLVSSVQFSPSVMFHSLRPHGMQHTRLHCPSPPPRACSNSCPSSQWCHPTISSSVIPFSCFQSFPASGSFQMRQFFASGGQSIGVSASASVLPMNIQD